MQEGRLAVLEAEKTYDPAKGATPASWAYDYIRNAVNRSLGLKWRAGQGYVLPPVPASLDAPVDQEGELMLGDVIEDPSGSEGWEDMAKQDVKREVLEAMGKLNKEQFTIAFRHILHHEPLADVAEDAGINNAQAVKQQTIQRLRKALLPFYREYVLDMDWYRKKGVEAFQRTHSSVVEDLVSLRTTREQRGNA